MPSFTAFCRRVACATFVFLVFASYMFSQTKTLTRTHDPIVYRVGNSLLTGISINELYAYRYDAGSDQWTAIPFQIDEIGSSGFLFDAGNGIVDAFDEAVFMPEDSRDKAPTNKWLNDSGALQNTRIELEVTDPIDNKKGWIYLYRKLSSPPAPTSYFTYTPPTTKGNDRIEGKSYSEANDTSGWYIDASVLLSAGGDGQDFIDRQKIRAEGFTVLTGDLKLRETDIFTYVGIKENFTTGAARVRGLRQLNLKASLAGLATADASFIKQFFPYSSVYRFQGIEIPDLGILGRVTKVRVSIDLNPHANGMKFFNQANRTGVTVDGVVDNLADKTLLPAPQLNWFMATGAPGTILVLAQVPQIGQTRSLFYKDDSTLNAQDTGDQRAYGDFLFEITQQTGTISGKFDFEIITYYFAPIVLDPAATGDQFKAWHDPSNLLQVQASVQELQTAVADRDGKPTSFALLDAQPNPFWPLRGSVRLSFRVGQYVKSPSLRIFNLLGQEVARFDFNNSQVANNGSAQQILWDGRGANNQLLPAGVYFYQLQAGAQIATKKLIIIR